MKNKFSFWRKTISGRLTIFYAAVFILVLLVLNGAALMGLRYFILNNARNNLDSTMEFVLNRIYKSINVETDIMQDISQTEQNIYFRILSPNHEIAAQSNLLEVEEVEMPIKKRFANLRFDNRHFIYKTSLIVNRGYFVGYLQVVREMSLEYRFLRVLFAVLGITSLLGSVGAIITGYTLTRKTLKPISLLTNTARNISSSDLSQRLEIEGPDDELAQLARTFNSMLERLELAFERQRKFVSDASHELRTPISVIKGYINLLDRWGKNDKEIREESIDAIKKEAENMNSLVENLLFLARGDSNNHVLDREKFNIADLLAELTTETEMLAEGLEVSSQTNVLIDIFADRKLIKQMLRAFIDNSIKYTPRGGKITINSYIKDEMVEIEIVDTGIGIPEEDLPYIFERFYRVDKSRSDRKGTGLGLTIAEWIIKKHNGMIDIFSGTGKGTKVSIKLPLL